MPAAQALPVLAPLPEQEATNLREIARECIDQSSDMSSAFDLFHQRVMADAGLLQEVVDRYLRAICRDIVNKAASNDRMYLEGKKSAPRRPINAGEFANAVTLSMLDYRVGGYRIGDLTRPELNTLADGLETQAVDVQIKARWLRLIAAKMPGDHKPVQEVLTSDLLETLRNEAREQV